MSSWDPWLKAWKNGLNLPLSFVDAIGNLHTFLRQISKALWLTLQVTGEEWSELSFVVAGRTVLEVLQDFSSARLPLNWLIQTCPRLQPRQFSIASSAAAHPRQAHITLAIVDYRTPFKRRKRGLCSSWLAALRPGMLTSASFPCSMPFST